MSVFRQHFSTPPKVWDLIKESSDRLVLFGAGAKGAEALRILRQQGYEPICFCDNNKHMWGNLYHEIPVVNYEQLMKEHSYSVILVTTTAYYMKQIEEQVRGSDDKARIFHFCPPFKMEERFLPHGELIDSIGDYERLFSSFADETSRNLFIKFIEYKMTGDNTDLLEEVSGDTFFDSELIDSSFAHCFVDVGAYTGDTIMKFCEFSGGNYRSIDGVELDEGNYQKLSSFVQYGRLPHVKLHKCGAWSKPGETTYYTLGGDLSRSFGNPNLFSSVDEKFDYEFKAEKKSNRVRPIEVHAKLDSVDNLLSGREATLVKINAMAADYEALLGCVKTIKNYRPSFVFDYGTKSSHIRSIPEYLISLKLGYRFYLRQKQIFGDSKTVLYAISPRCGNPVVD